MEQRNRTKSNKHFEKQCTEEIVFYFKPDHLDFNILPDFNLL